MNSVAIAADVFLVFHVPRKNLLHLKGVPNQIRKQAVWAW